MALVKSYSLEQGMQGHCTRFALETSILEAREISLGSQRSSSKAVLMRDTGRLQEGAKCCNTALLIGNTVKSPLALNLLFQRPCSSSATEDRVLGRWDGLNRKTETAAV